jgi:hypothetical protein
MRSGNCCRAAIFFRRISRNFRLIPRETREKPLLSAISTGANFAGHMLKFARHIFRTIQHEHHAREMRDARQTDLAADRFP